MMDLKEMFLHIFRNGGQNVLFVGVEYRGIGCPVLTRKLEGARDGRCLHNHRKICSRA